MRKREMGAPQRMYLHSCNSHTLIFEASEMNITMFYDYGRIHTSKIRTFFLKIKAISTLAARVHGPFCKAYFIHAQSLSSGIRFN